MLGGAIGAFGCALLGRANLRTGRGDRVAYGYTATERVISGRIFPGACIGTAGNAGEPEGQEGGGASTRSPGLGEGGHAIVLIHG